MSTWPPPPDLASIKELVRDADTEEFIVIGGPPDEYDGEAEELFAKIGLYSTDQLTAANILPHIEAIWCKSFDYDEAVRVSIRPSLAALAQQIARFFGPEAKPLVRDGSP